MVEVFAVVESSTTTAADYSVARTGLRRSVPRFQAQAQERSRMVSTEENKRLVRRFYEDVVNTGNVDQLDGLDFDRLRRSLQQHQVSHWH